MLLLGFGAALRRSELVALQIGDAEPMLGRRLRLLVRRSKADQHGRGYEVAIWANPGEALFCPFIVLEAWLGHCHPARDFERLVAESTRRKRRLFYAVAKAGWPTGDVLFDKAVARLIKGAAACAGLDPERCSGHSLRAGLATAAAGTGATLPQELRMRNFELNQAAWY
jgi:integrase